LSDCTLSKPHRRSHRKRPQWDDPGFWLLEKLSFQLIALLVVHEMLRPLDVTVHWGTGSIGQSPAVTGGSWRMSGVPQLTAGIATASRTGSSCYLRKYHNPSTALPPASVQLLERLQRIARQRGRVSCSSVSRRPPDPTRCIERLVTP
jgi:hypothetical protein